MESLEVLEAHLQQWAVPSDVREAVWRAVSTVSREGASLVDDAYADHVILAVQGQPAAVYVSSSGVSAALAPVDADRAHRSDSALGLEKLNETSWIVHCRYGRLDPSRLNAMTALMVRALRRYAPRREPRQVVKQPRRRAAGSATGASASSSSGRTRSPSATKSSPRQTARTQEERRQAADAAIPRCPVPGCNLPMVGGSCGFHD